jgi:poly(A) polymerase
MGPLLTDLLDLSRADVTSKRPGKRQRCLSLISELSRRIREIAELDARVPPLPSGVGDVLMRELGLAPGKVVGLLRQRLTAMCEAGELEAGRPAEYYVEAVRERGLLAELAGPPA